MEILFLGNLLFVQKLSTLPHHELHEARLESPYFSDLYGCLQFRYILYGNHWGEIRVYIKSQNKEPGTLSWIRRFNQGHKWHLARIRIGHLVRETSQVNVSGLVYVPQAKASNYNNTKIKQRNQSKGTLFVANINSTISNHRTLPLVGWTFRFQENELSSVL